MLNLEEKLQKTDSFSRFQVEFELESLNHQPLSLLLSLQAYETIAFAATVGVPLVVSQWHRLGQFPALRCHLAKEHHYQSAASSTVALLGVKETTGAAALLIRSRSNADCRGRGKTMTLPRFRSVRVSY